MFVVIGYLVILICVFGGFALEGGHVLALFQPIELLMIGGAAAGSFIVANDTRIIKQTLKALKSAVKKTPYNRQYYIELLSLFFELTNKIRKDGVLAIENDIENYHESVLFSNYKKVQNDAVVMEFLCDHLRLVITGRVDVTHLEMIMDSDIETFEEESEEPIGAVNKVADGLPAFGIVAAVMGVVHTMESIGAAPEKLGGMVAKALVGTFLGVLIGYGFTAPLATIMESRTHTVIKIMQAIKVVLLAATHNFAPTITVEFARKILYASERPNSRELEDILKEIKSTKKEG